jgi:hypothetical protein
MDSYFYPITLRCEEQLRQYAISEIERVHGADVMPKMYKQQLFLWHTFPEDLLNIVNAELAEYGIPEIDYAKSYARKAGNMQGAHIDGKDDYVVSTAINIPLKGAKDSKHVYFEGTYDSKPIHMNGLDFHDLKWSDRPKRVAELELLTPHLVRVDRPHAAYASPTEDRWILTIRFAGNPQFDEVVNRIKNGNQ